MLNTKTDIDKLIYIFSKMPGLGPRSARRVVLHLLKNKEIFMRPLADSIYNAYNTAKFCNICGNLDSQDVCAICLDERRDQSVICVVETIADLWAMERGSIYRGIYHVLGGVLSAAEGRTPSDLTIEKLVSRVGSSQVVKEVIIATNATVEGQTTAFYLIDKLSLCNIAITRLAQGVPIGGELDYLDEGTLGAALASRGPIK